MIRHIFKIVWSEKKVNLWIVLELLIVFTVLWFFVERVGVMIYKALEPTGFDIENCYKVNLRLKEESISILNGVKDIDEAKRVYPEYMDYYWQIVDRIKVRPEVENACLSILGTPYSGGFGDSYFSINSDTTQYWLFQKRFVTPEFFDVFRVKFLEGRNFTEDETLSERALIIAPTEKNTLGSVSVDKIKTVQYQGSEEEDYKVVGVINPMKYHEYGGYIPLLYIPIGRNSFNVIGSDSDICIRVKSGVKKGFEERFIKELTEQMETSPYYITEILSFAEVKSKYMKRIGYKEVYVTVFSVAAFLLVNIFLGVVGTFWFRIQSRRREIGLRQVVGSSKSSVRRMMLIEALIILFVASIIATILSVNFTITGLSYEVWGKRISGIEPIRWNFSHFVVNYLWTFLLLGSIVVLGVWYPARQASEVQPVEVLHEE